MCDMIIQGCSQAAYGAYEAIAAIGTAINTHWTTLGRKVEQLADDHLHPAVADVAKKAFWALPYTVASLLLPSYITLPLWIGYTIIHIVHNQPFSNETYDNIHTGMGNAYIVRAVKATVQFVMTGNSLFVITGIIDTLIAGFFHGRVPAGHAAPQPAAAAVVTETPKKDQQEETEVVI